MDRVRMQMLAVMCSDSSDMDLWNSSSGLFHLKKEKEIGAEREGGKGKKRSINNANWILWGNSWWDAQWPKGGLFRSGQGASHGPAAFILLEVDGWSVFIFIMQMEEEKSWPYQLTTILENQCLNFLRKTFGFNRKKRQIKVCERFCFTETVMWGPTLWGEIILSRRINHKKHPQDKRVWSTRQKNIKLDGDYKCSKYEVRHRWSRLLLSSCMH